MIGYINGFDNYLFEREQLKALQNVGIETIFFEKEQFSFFTEEEEHFIDFLINSMNTGDTLVVYELRCINKSIVELSKFFDKIKKLKINFVIINKGDAFCQIDDTTYIDMISELAKMQKKVTSERTKRGLEIAKKNGKIGGRPKISSETINKIKHLYQHKKITLREIATECGVSLGTAYKYVNDLKKNNSK